MPLALVMLRKLQEPNCYLWNVHRPKNMYFLKEYVIVALHFNTKEEGLCFILNALS